MYSCALVEHIQRKKTCKAMAPADPLPSSSPTFESVLSALPSSTHELIAEVSVAESEAALAPPVPSLAIAVMAAAEMVRADGSVTLAKTVATFVVDKTLAETLARIVSSGMNWSCMFGKVGK